MIIKGLFELVYNLLNVVLTPFQFIPSMPGSVSTFLNALLDFAFGGINILLYFLPVNFCKLCIPIIIAIVNMEHIWDGILWILKKLPFVGIE